ncbi:MAG: bifunctional phosphopantothenoylcysteine decarboxylase/phosphopantothenate synthase [Chlorobiota bacterium]|nr:MAG: bifunctional phosphopantothenoylcysteine decarboxylase/phosphopantothenate synthase [Chlorobiota bacterium]
MEQLRGKRIIVGVGGSIAAYKAPHVVRLLRQCGADVRVAMTPSARHFVSPMVLGNLSGEAVALEMFDEQIQHGGSWHIHWAQWADAMLIAPCSAHLLGSLAHGLCDSVVACLALALPRSTPLVVAPAMDTTMWEHPATQRNVEQLRRDGATIIPPEEGELASGLWGVGRMPEPSVIVEHLASAVSGAAIEASRFVSSRPLDETVRADRLTAEIALAQLVHGEQGRLDGVTVLITAGPTREALDAVRFLSNRSSGKMGYALAEAARDRKARVVLVSGPVALDPPQGVELVKVETARQMLEAVERYRGQWSIAMAAAAVADFMPATPSPGKLKRNEIGDRITVELVRTPDILAALGQSKPPDGVLVGFALEEQQRLDDGIAKLRVRGCDVAVLNALDAPESGFEGDSNTITIVTFDGDRAVRHSYAPAPKRVCAEYVLDHAVRLLYARRDTAGRV